MGGHISVVWMEVCFLCPDHSVLPCSESWRFVRDVCSQTIHLPYMMCDGDGAEGGGPNVKEDANIRPQVYPQGGELAEHQRVPMDSQDAFWARSGSAQSRDKSALA